MRIRPTLFVAAALAILVATGAGAASTPGSALILPYYQLDAANPGGVTMLWAVRNVSAAPIVLVAHYFNFSVTDGSAPTKAENFVVPPGHTQTRNVRDVVGAPSEGWAALYASSPEGALVPEAIYGDFFWVEPGNAFASGGQLLRQNVLEGALGLPTPAQPDLCTKMHTRFLNGAGFSGGTDFAIWANWQTAHANPIVTAKVYSQDGVLAATCTFNGPSASNGVFARRYALTTAFIPPRCDNPVVLPYGLIEWTFAPGVVGHVTAEMRASGQFSVSVPGFCME